jgi:hypothetical protein
VVKLKACQCHVINLCRKHDYLLVQMSNADGTPVFFDMLASRTIDTNGSTGHEK